MPSLEQVDGYMLKQLFAFTQSAPKSVVGITKKDIDPKAMEILEDILKKWLSLNQVISTKLFIHVLYILSLYLKTEYNN